jgi:hypothetical protein
MRRQLWLSDRLGRVCERAPVEVPVAQHTAAGALEDQVIGALPGEGRGDLLGQELGGWDRALFARLGRVEDRRPWSSVTESVRGSLTTDARPRRVAGS